MRPEETTRRVWRRLSLRSRRKSLGTSSWPNCWGVLLASRSLSTPRNANTAQKLFVTLASTGTTNPRSSSATASCASCAKVPIWSLTGPFSLKSCRTSSTKSKLRIDALGSKNCKFLQSRTSRGMLSQVTVAAISTSAFADRTRGFLTRESESTSERSAAWWGCSAGTVTPIMITRLRALMSSKWTTSTNTHSPGMSSKPIHAMSNRKKLMIAWKILKISAELKCCFFRKAHPWLKKPRVAQTSNLNSINQVQPIW